MSGQVKPFYHLLSLSDFLELIVGTESILRCKLQNDILLVVLCNPKAHTFHLFMNCLGQNWQAEI